MYLDAIPADQRRAVNIVDEPLFGPKLNPTGGVNPLCGTNF